MHSIGKLKTKEKVKRGAKIKIYAFIHLKDSNSEISKFIQSPIEINENTNYYI